MIAPAQVLRASNSFPAPFQKKLSTDGELSSGYLGENKASESEKYHDTMI